MGLENRRNSGADFVSILADGKFHLEVEKDTEGAILREYETSDKKTGSKYELLFDTLEGMITSLTFREGEFGSQLYMGINDVVVCMGVASSYAEDVMKKVPNINFDKPITLQPYAFEDDNKKTRKGVTLTQDGQKLTNYFYDPVAKKNINGYPEPTGDTKTFTKEHWKAYFGGARMFLMDYITKHHLKEMEKSEADKLYEGMPPSVQDSTDKAF